MKIIQSQYRSYYKDEAEIKFALSVMNKLFENYSYTLIEKALLKFLRSDSKGFPPVAGQLITIADEIRKFEWQLKQIETDRLPAPKTERVEMPEAIKQKMNDWSNAYLSGKR